MYRWEENIIQIALCDSRTKVVRCYSGSLFKRKMTATVGILVVLTNILVIIVSMALTLVTFFAYCQINAIAVVWYMVVAAVVLGFLVSYAAMFGFDKLKEALAQIGKQ